MLNYRTLTKIGLITALLSVMVEAGNSQNTAGSISGEPVKWHTVTIDFEGPEASEPDNDPNPFLDYRLQVEFTGPGGQVYDVPGFFAGDGEGGETGKIWRVRFTPDEAGIWSYRASFRTAEQIAAYPDRTGETAGFDGAEGRFKVEELDSAAPGFLKKGRLEYVGKHYLKFSDGDYWIKGGTDSPENFLAYKGFDNTRASTQNYDDLESVPTFHGFEVHEEDWQAGDPDWGDGRGKGIIGALNYLSSKHVNSIYFLTMNIGGDGKDVFPWTGAPVPGGSPENDNLHYDISKLRQWNIVFEHAQKKGIFLHFVFNEAEEANKRELDDGELGPERKLYYREMIARFSHHPALQWNISEEYNLGFDLGADRVRKFAGYIKRIDPYNHPVTVHSAGDPLEELAFMFGDSLFGNTSVQLNQRRIDRIAEGIREATEKAGRPLPASMDEFTVSMGTNRSWIPVDDAKLQRKEKLWPTYLSGGQIEFILEGFLEVDSFKKPELEALWNYTWHARKFMEEYLPFEEMEPMDQIVSNESTLAVGEADSQSSEMGAQVYGKPGEVYAIYFPVAESTGSIDLTNTSGQLSLRWYNPRTGKFSGTTERLDGGDKRAIGQPPSYREKDWVVFIQKL